MVEAARTHTGFEANCLGKYTLIAGLGHGGMAAVHLAVVRGPASFNKLVVIKQIHQHYADDPEVLGMFLDEAKLAARLSHPNVVQTNEVGQEDERHFLVMEYLDGQPLNRITQRLGKHGGLPLHMHLQVIVDLLDGLHYAHELTDYDGTSLGVVHRDITPQNIFVTYDGVVKIVDFGIAKARHALTQTRVGIIKGKLAYMAPEQARSDEVDRRADVFAVGVMLWEAATGARPWKGVTEISLLKNLLAGQFPSARSIKPDIPEALAAIIEKALAPDREDRYATAAALQAALEAYLETTGERPHQRDLGKLISKHFEAERVHIKAVIEEQLQSYGLPAGGGHSLPIIDHTTAPDGENHVRRPHESNPALQGEASLLGSSTSRPSVLATSELSRRDTPARSRRRAFVGATVLLAGAALFAAIGVEGRRAPPIAQAVSSAPASPELPEKVELRLSASPDEARLFLDDKLLVGNPFRISLPRDGAAHRLRAEAAGFVAWNESVVLDRDRGIEIALAAEPAAPAVAATSSASAPGSHAGQPQPSSRHRKLDVMNPYGR